MISGIIGRKLGMTQLFAEDGTVTPVTVIKAGPCVVVQVKTAGTDKYESVQLGLVEERPARVKKPLEGHYKKAGVPPTRIIFRTFRFRSSNLSAAANTSSSVPARTAADTSAWQSATMRTRRRRTGVSPTS